MRLIDADELELWLKRVGKFLKCEEDSKRVTKLIGKIIDHVNNAPTVEARPVVTGEWKRVGSGSLYDTYECTNCHKQPKWDCLGDNHWRIAFTDICPHCGADMRGGKNE